MAAKGSGPADEWRETQRWGDGTDGGVGWIAYPDEGMQRASAALAVDGDVWVVDPVDTPDLDDLLSEFGAVRGVVLLLDRHERDAAAVARRHDVPVYLPETFDGVEADLDAPVERFGAGLPDTDYRSLTVADNRLWQETALFDGETLVVAEALGTVGFMAPGDERLGVHPGLRLFPPRGQFGGLDPERILVGHGEGIPGGDGASAALTSALSSARRTAPRAFATMVSGMVRG